MVSAQDDLTKLYNKIEKMVDGDWTLPTEVEELDWMGPVVSSDPDSALETGVRTIGAEDPKFFLTPLAPGEDNQETVDNLEAWIAWEWKWGDFRTDKDATKDIIRSALTYGRVCIHVTNMKHDLEGMQDAGKDYPNWYEQVEGYGDYDIQVCSPKNVFFKRGKYGLEAVAHVYKCNASQAIEDYKGLVPELEKEYERSGYEDFEVVVTDLTKRDRRVIWISKLAIIDDSGEVKTSETVEAHSPSRWVVMNEPREVPFIPWVIRSGGTSLRREVKKHVKPMLAKIVETNLWDIQNTILSLTYSEAIATSAQPRFAIIGPNGEITAVDYRDPTRLMQVPENHQLIQLQPRGIDEGLLHLSDRIKAMMDRETVARFLQNLDIPDEAAYASINAVMQSAIAALDVYKDLAQTAHAEAGVLMLRWMHYREDDAVVYGVGEQKEQVLVSWKDFDPKALYMDVELTSKAPTDYMQRINAAVALNQQLWFPREEAYKFLAVPNPKELEEKHVQEQIRDFALKMKLSGYQAKIQMNIQQQMVSQRQRMTRPAGPPLQAGGQSAMSRPTPEQRAAFAMARGAGNRFNPGAGGSPPAMTNPGATREQITGQDRQGQQVVA